MIIDKILTIRGVGLGTRVHTYDDGSSNARVFTISGSGMIIDISDLEIAFGQDTQGGGLYSSGNELHITNVAFTGNRATQSGGGAFITGGQATLSNVLFVGNQALNNDGGGLHVDSVNLTMTNTSFSANSAAQAGGGISNEEGSSTIRNSVFYTAVNSFKETSGPSVQVTAAIPSCAPTASAAGCCRPPSITLH